MALKRVISGAQDGADIAGLRAAKKAGLVTGGYMPKDFLARSGFHPEYATMYGILTTASPEYPERTKWNVRQSDGTLRLAYNWNSRGEQLTLSEIQRAGKPHFDVTIGVNAITFWVPNRETYLKSLWQWVIEERIEILNVAGNSDERIEPIVEEFLLALFKTV